MILYVCMYEHDVNYYLYYLNVCEKVKKKNIFEVTNLKTNIYIYKKKKNSYFSLCRSLLSVYTILFSYIKAFSNYSNTLKKN